MIVKKNDVIYLFILLLLWQPFTQRVHSLRKRSFQALIEKTTIRQSSWNT